MDSGFTIANWREYQHYQKRNPPWIKLHLRLLQSEMWIMLDDASRVLAVACMLLASRNNGQIPADPLYLQKAAALNTTPDFAPLVNYGFLIPCGACKQDASKMLAKCYSQSESEAESEPPLPPKGKSPKKQHSAAVQGAAQQVIQAVNDKFGLARSTTQPLLNAVALLVRNGFKAEDAPLVAKHRLQVEEWYHPRKYGAEALIRLKSFESALERAREDGEQDGIFKY